MTLGVLGEGFGADQAAVAAEAAGIAEHARREGREADAGHAQLLEEIALGDAPCGEITRGIGNKGLFVVFSKAHFVSSHWFIVKGLVRILTPSGIQE